MAMVVEVTLGCACSRYSRSRITRDVGAARMIDARRNHGPSGQQRVEQQATHGHGSGVSRGRGVGMAWRAASRYGGAGAA
ncbi:hypothetical protein NL676_002302 [Syzygium grande]|nr:hypothetical protein NL676_002302 [Syzygium grande]